MARMNICLVIFRWIMTAVLGIFLLLFVPTLFLSLTPVYLIRFIVSKLSRILRPDLGKIMHTRGATLAVDNIYSGTPKCNIFVAGVVDGRLELETFVNNCKHVLKTKLEEGFECLEMQQYITSWMGFHFWKWDKDFRVENHVKYYDGIFKDKIAKDGLTEDIMPLLGNEFVRKPFHPKRSPWEAYLVNDVRLKDGDPINKPKSFLVLRIHHSLADGFAVLKLITIDFMSAQYERAQARYLQRSKWQKFCDAFAFIVKAPFEGAAQIIDAVDFNDWHISERRLNFDYNIGCTERIPLDIIKDIKNHYDTSFNSVLLAAFAGGIRKFMMQNDFKVPRKISCLTPLPMPGHPSKLRNHLTLCVISLPTGQADPIKRVMELEREMGRQKNSTVPLSLFIMGPLFGALFNWMIRLTFANYATTTVLTSMPGPDRVIAFLGCPLDDVVFGGGLLAGNCGVGLASLSYNGAIRMGTAVDTGIFSGRDKIDELMADIRDELRVIKSADQQEVV